MMEMKMVKMDIGEVRMEGKQKKFRLSFLSSLQLFLANFRLPSNTLYFIFSPF